MIVSHVAHFCRIVFVRLEFVFTVRLLFVSALPVRKQSKAKQYPENLLQLEKVTSNLRTLDLASVSTPPSSNTHIVDSR